MNRNGEWKIESPDVFWGEMAPSSHLLQIYENESVFLNTLEGFVKNGFLSGDSVVVLATLEHIEALELRLQFKGFDLEGLRKKNIYFPFDAASALEKFMVNDWPDEALFRRFIRGILNRVKQEGRLVRAFGELVVLLWQQGNHGATVRLEHLWHQLIEEEKLKLFCAYPKSGFTQDSNLSLEAICACHSTIISGEALPSVEVYYKIGRAHV